MLETLSENSLRMPAYDGGCAELQLARHHLPPAKARRNRSFHAQTCLLLHLPRHSLLCPRMGDWSSIGGSIGIVCPGAEAGPLFRCHPLAPGVEREKGTALHESSHAHNKESSLHQMCQSIHLGCSSL